MPCRIDQHLGARIAEAREQSGLSVDALAQRVDITAQLLTQYETGSERIPALAVAQMARALNVSPGWFYRGLPGQDAFDRAG